MKHATCVGAAVDDSRFVTTARHAEAKIVPRVGVRGVEAQRLREARVGCPLDVIHLDSLPLGQQLPQVEPRSGVRGVHAQGLHDARLLRVTAV